MTKREFTKSRHALRRELARVFSAVVRKTRWRACKGTLIGEREGWFLAAQEMVGILRPETTIRISIKPMVIDPIFWDMSGVPQLAKESLSFRYFGALACRPLILGHEPLDEAAGTEGMARQALDLVEAKLATIPREWTLERFRDEAAACPNRSWMASSVVAATTALGRRDEALAMSAAMAARGDPGGYVGPSGSFAEQSADWLRAPSA